MPETAASPMVPRAEKPTISDVVEEIGFGRSQFFVMVVACGPFLAEGLELLMVSLLADSIAVDLDDDKFSASALIFWVLMGTVIGNALAGPIADSIGRQYPIIAGYFIVVLFSMISSFMNSMPTISLLRSFVGFGYGLGQPAALVLMSEVMPANRRLVALSAAALAMTIGALLAVVMVMLNDVRLGSMEEKTVIKLEWRLLLRCAAVPAMLVGFASLFALPESPSFLAATGDFALARDSLQDLAVGNGKLDTRVEFRHSEAEHLSVLAYMRRFMFESTFFVICFGSWVLNFALYGCSYMIPQALIKVSVGGNVLGLAPASILVLAFALACFCIVAGTILGSKGSAKVRIILPILVAIFSTVLFNTSSANAKQLQWPLVLSCVGLWCAPAFAILSLIKATLEMYPILATATCTGLCVAIGRLGAVVVPFVVDYATDPAGSNSTFFLLVAILELVTVLMFLPLELPLASQSKDVAKDFA